MYDDLLRRLRNAEIIYAGMATLLPHGGGNATAELIKEAADAIEELSHKVELLGDANKSLMDAAPEWISVEERLPEEGAWVLVCFDCKGKKYVDTAELLSDGKFHNYADEYLTPEGRKYRRGIYWMPLPEPPKEDNP